MEGGLKGLKSSVPGTVKVASPIATISPVVAVPEMMTLCLPLDDETVLIVTGRIEPGKQTQNKLLVYKSSVKLHGCG